MDVPQGGAPRRAVKKLTIAAARMSGTPVDAASHLPIPSRLPIRDGESLADAHHEHGAFDLVCINGVFNYGIDTPGQQAEAVRTAHLLLRPGGRLLIGYSDTADHSDVGFELIDPGSSLSHAFASRRAPALHAAISD